MSVNMDEQKSKLWYLLPVFLGIIGGVIAYFVLRKDDPAKAKNCLYLGLALMAIGILFNIALDGTNTDLDSGFDINV